MTCINIVFEVIFIKKIYIRMKIFIQFEVPNNYYIIYYNVFL